MCKANNENHLGHNMKSGKMQTLIPVPGELVPYIPIELEIVLNSLNPNVISLLKNLFTATLA